MDDPTQRGINALELIAAELEKLRLLREYELGAHIEHSPDPYVRPDDATE
jgi:hypothetical protein